MGQLVRPFKESLLVGADSRPMSFRTATLRRLDFAKADMSGCAFGDAVFDEGCSLRDALIEDRRFGAPELREADLNGLKPDNAKLFAGRTISSH